MISVVFETEAQADVLRVFTWYEEQRAGLGLSFREEVDAVVRRIGLEPQAFALQHRELRRALVRRFPYALYFRALPNLVVVVAVVHGRRHASTWRQRT